MWYARVTRSLGWISHIRKLVLHPVNPLGPNDLIFSHELFVSVGWFDLKPEIMGVRQKKIHK